MAILLPGQYFGIHDTFKKPAIRDYTVKCASTTGKVWLIPTKYIFEQATTLTRYKMREQGQLEGTHFADRVKHTDGVTQFINQEYASKNNSKKNNHGVADHSSIMLKKELKDSYIENYTNVSVINYNKLI